MFVYRTLARLSLAPVRIRFVRAVVQRVSEASVAVDGAFSARPGAGWSILLGVAEGDDLATAERLAGKVARLRIFENEDGRFDRSLLDVGGEALVVSQFTLIADTRKGNRPSFTGAAPPEVAEPLYEHFCAALEAGGRPRRSRRVRRAHGGLARERRPGDDRARLVVSGAAFALALGAAVLHAGWNVLLARARDVRAATIVALGLSVLLFAPVAALTWDLEAAAVPWIAASAVFQLAYIVLLATAYGRSDVSLVYPVSRGVAPVLVLAGGAAAGSALGGWAALGVILVGTGVVLVRGVRGTVDTRGLLLALAIAATIAGYTLVDKQGIEHASPVVYLELVLLPVALATFGWHLARGEGARLRAEAGLVTLAIAVGSFGAYALVLAALSLAPAAAVAAVRETSILFAVALAAVVLRERVGALRIVGAVLVVAGVALVAAG